MYRDTTIERIHKYENNLRLCPLLEEAAQSVHKGVESPGPILQADCDYVISPTLHGYVLWVLRQALKQGVGRLYFLARDGYLMYRAAGRICRALQVPIECRYLYCSRYSVRIPMFHMEPEQAMDFICRGGIDVTLGKVLNRAGLTAEEQAKVCEELTGSPSAETPIPYARLPQLKESLRKNEYFVTCMTRHSEEALPALKGYFQQEGLMEEVPMALVDSGWTGSMQKVINRLLGAFGKQADFLTGYYWGLYELPPDVDPGNYHCYYFSPDTHLEEKVYFSNNLFEEIFSAPHGITLRYEETEGMSQPVMQQADERHQEFCEQMEERASAYTDALLMQLSQRENASAEELLACDGDLALIRAQLALFMGTPTKEEAELFGRLSFSDDVLEYGGALAAQMSDQELTKNHASRKLFSLLGASKAPLKESAWYEASAVLSGQRVRRHLRGYARYKHMLYRNKARNYRRQRG